MINTQLSHIALKGGEAIYDYQVTSMLDIVSTLKYLHDS
jgi:hypothetical protein